MGMRFGIPVSSRGVGFDGLALFEAETVALMVVDDTDSLHECVHDGRTNECESTSFKRFGHGMTTIHSS